MSKIPEGATHTIDQGIGYRRRNPDGTWDARWPGFNSWQAVSVPSPERYQPIAIQAWNGEGLPPVGTVCEYQTWVNREWKKTKILAHHLGFAVHSWSSDGDDVEVEATVAQDFRPIRTAEQIAAEAREKMIAQMVSDSICEDGSALWLNSARKLYDAGWRKLYDAGWGKQENPQ